MTNSVSEGLKSLHTRRRGPKSQMAFHANEPLGSLDSVHLATLTFKCVKVTLLSYSSDNFLAALAPEVGCVIVMATGSPLQAV